MKFRIPFTVIFVLLFSSILPQLASQAQFSLQNLKDISFTYNPEAGHEETVAIQVKHKGDASNYFLSFSRGSSDTFDPRTLIQTPDYTLAYFLYDNSSDRNILKDLSVAVTSSEVLEGSFPAKVKGGWQTQTLNFTFYMEPGLYDLFGTYNDTVTVSLYDGTPDNPGGVQDSLSFTIKVKLDKVIALSIVDTGRVFDPPTVQKTFDFGILSEGSTRMGDLVIRANTPYTIQLSSENDGLMINQDKSDTSVVPYNFTFNGAVIDFANANPGVVEPNGGPTPYDGSRYRFIITIGAYGMATEGNYSDTVAVTVSAN